jgi:glucokinase
MLLGFDIGGTKCAIIIGRLSPENTIDIIDKRVLPTNRPVYEMIDWLFKTADELLKENQVSIEK